MVLAPESSWREEKGGGTGAQTTFAGFNVGGLPGPQPAWGVKELEQWIKVPFTIGWAQRAHMPPIA